MAMWAVHGTPLYPEDPFYLHCVAESSRVKEGNGSELQFYPLSPCGYLTRSLRIGRIGRVGTFPRRVARVGALALGVSSALLSISSNCPAMTYRSTSRGILLFLLGGAAILPASACVVLVLSALLRAMGDSTGAQVLVYASWGIGVLWCISLIALVFLLAIRVLVEAEVRKHPSRADREHWREDPDG